MSEHAGALTHDRAWELLPWLVNDTLEGAEREALEKHVATCRECRAEEERCRAVAALVRAAEVAPSPHPAQLTRLVRRVDELEATRSRRSMVALLGGTPMSVRWALAAQAAVLVLLLGIIFWPSPRPGFRTLSDPTPASVDVAPGQRLLRVVFTPTATEADLRRLLLEVQGEIVHGPSPLGAYTVAVPATGAGAEPLSLVLDHLRDDPHVRLAEPVTGGGAG
jgi:hypothetical protein